MDHGSHNCRVNLVLTSLSTHLDILRHREGLGTEVVNTYSTHAKIKHYQFPPCFSICFRSQLEQGQRSTNSLIFLILHHRTLLGRMKPALNLKGVKFWAIPKERLKSPPEQLLPSALSSCGLPFQSWTPPWCCSLVCLFSPPGCSEDIAPAESLLQFGQNWKKSNNWETYHQLSQNESTRDSVVCPW